MLEAITQSFPFFLRTFTFETPHSQLGSNFRLFLGCFLDCFFFLGLLFFCPLLFFWPLFPLPGLFPLSSATWPEMRPTSGTRPRRPSDWSEWLPSRSGEGPGELLVLPRRSRQQDPGSREEAGELLELPRRSRQQETGSRAHCPFILLP